MSGLTLRSISKGISALKKNNAPMKDLYLHASKNRVDALGGVEAIEKAIFGEWKIRVRVIIDEPLPLQTRKKK